MADREITDGGEDFTLPVLGTDETIRAGEYYFTDDGRIVLKHDRLVSLAEAHGAKTDRTVMEYGVWNSASNFYFVHRSFGTLPDGTEVTEVGDACPANLGSAIAKSIPAVMSDKRSKDKLLIRLLGLRGTVWSDSEFGPKRPVPEENADPEKTVINFGRWKGKGVTLGDALRMYRNREDDLFAFLVTLDPDKKYPDGNPYMKSLHETALRVYRDHAAELTAAETAAGTAAAAENGQA